MGRPPGSPAVRGSGQDRPASSVASKSSTSSSANGRSRASGGGGGKRSAGRMWPLPSVSCPTRAGSPWRSRYIQAARSRPMRSTMPSPVRRRVAMASPSSLCSQGCLSSPGISARQGWPTRGSISVCQRIACPLSGSPSSTTAMTALPRAAIASPGAAPATTSRRKFDSTNDAAGGATVAGTGTPALVSNSTQRWAPGTATAA